MIHYPLEWSQLEAEVDKQRPTWRDRAAHATDIFRRRKAYVEPPVGDGEKEPPAPFWGEVKSLFMGLQHNKCAYCERDLEGAIEFDVEHFRPKRGVALWPPSQKRPTGQSLRFEFSTGAAMPEGYYLLAYHLRNYAVACKPCNSNLKKNYFPIAGSRLPGTDNLALLASEKPLLIYPISDLDAAPEDLITFIGPIPIPVAKAGYDYQRGLVTIEFFELRTREELMKQRYARIRDLWTAILAHESGDGRQKSFGDETIEMMLHPSSPHCNCARAFYQSYLTDRAFAEIIAYEALDILKRLQNKKGHADGNKS